MYIYRMFSLENLFTPKIIMVDEGSTGLQELYSNLKETPIGPLAFEPFVFKDEESAAKFMEDYSSLTVTMGTRKDDTFKLCFVFRDDSNFQISDVMNELFPLNQRVSAPSDIPRLYS